MDTPPYTRCCLCLESRGGKSRGRCGGSRASAPAPAPSLVVAVALRVEHNLLNQVGRVRKLVPGLAPGALRNHHPPVPCNRVDQALGGGACCRGRRWGGRSTVCCTAGRAIRMATPKAAAQPSCAPAPAAPPCAPHLLHVKVTSRLRRGSCRSMRGASGSSPPLPLLLGAGSGAACPRPAGAALPAVVQCSTGLFHSCVASVCSAPCAAGRRRRPGDAHRKGLEATGFHASNLGCVRMHGCGREVLGKAPRVWCLRAGTHATPQAESGSDAIVTGAVPTESTLGRRTQVLQGDGGAQALSRTSRHLCRPSCSVGTPCRALGVRLDLQISLQPG